MSRFRTPSAAFAGQVNARTMQQRQAAASVAVASNTAAAIEAVEAVDAPAINARLADFETRIDALETP